MTTPPVPETNEPIAPNPQPEPIPPASPAPETPPVARAVIEPAPAAPQPAPAVVQPAQRKAPPQRRGSLFFPLLLIFIGGALLMNNLGMINGSIWETIAMFWPVLFIVWGLDALWRNEGLTGAVLMLGLGISFLLSNLGYLQINPWRMLATIWPVIFVAIGMDLIIGRRRNWLTMILGLLVVLAVLAGALWYSGIWQSPSALTAGEPLNVAPQPVASAQIEIKPGVGSLKIDGQAAPGTLISGMIPETSDTWRVNQEISQSGDQVVVRLSANGSQAFYPGNRQNLTDWQLGFNPAIPIELAIDLGAGEADLDLSKLQVGNLKYDFGVGTLTLALPQGSALIGDLNGGIGFLTIQVPSSVGIEIQAETGLVIRSFPTGYTKVAENLYRSPNYQTAATKVNLKINLALGQVIIK
ncbi:MAG: DUF5668 domain-containing protein [Anaerolineales bacterium]|nr:DUF5668 domain-containing protein [Anaerolineales bacterium]